MRTVTCIDCGTARVLTGHSHRDLCSSCAKSRDGKERRAKKPGAWAEAGLCAQVDGELWFPEKGAHGTAAKARAICRRCPVIDQCLEWALQTDQEYGIYGGLTRTERRRRAAA